MAVAAGIVTLNIIMEGFVYGLTDNYAKEASKKHTYNSRLEYKNHTLSLTKMAKMDALFVTKTANSLGLHIHKKPR